MMNKVNFFVIAGIAIVFSSCSKENNSSREDDGKVKTYTEIQSLGSNSVTNTANLEYDNQNRIVGYTSSTISGGKMVYTYSGKDITMEIYNSSVLTVHETFFLNSNNSIDSTLQYDDSDQYKDTTTEKYYYNLTGQLTGFSQYDYSSQTGATLYNTTSITYDSDGNLITTTDTDGNKETFDYYPDLINTVPLISPVQASYKKGNLIKKHTIYYDGSVEDSFDVTYTFDTKNRISTIVETDDNGLVYTKEFTYFN